MILVYGAKRTPNGIGVWCQTDAQLNELVCGAKRTPNGVGVGCQIALPLLTKRVKGVKGVPQITRSLAYRGTFGGFLWNYSCGNSLKRVISVK